MSVVERPDNFQVDRPTSSHTHIQPFEAHSKQRSALIFLNQAIRGIDLENLWESTELHVCADGGANQLYEYFESDEVRKDYIPQFIVGDFDSLTTKVREYYSNHGSIVIEQTSQYSTDFMKALNVVQLYFHSESARRMLHKDISLLHGVADILDQQNVDPLSEPTIRLKILSGIGGRFDQTVHSITQLYGLSRSCPYLQLFFITRIDTIFLLKKGLNYVSYESREVFFDGKVPVCGLLPLGCPVVLNTRGLKYDVENWPSDMLGNVSSSNGVTGVNGFQVETTQDVVINIETRRVGR